ncbi:hypothetical protein Csa_019046 [Cucumis sativus]|uniref:Uncharacterized protein n=1 Tax=Cucumis sativus TaxID=3659 RepID=A0A0A0KCY5_CUCSA|nr:hypothetical protein Csa_019046 [Cucumis sativus]
MSTMNGIVIFSTSSGQSKKKLIEAGILVVRVKLSCSLFRRQRVNKGERAC